MSLIRDAEAEVVARHDFFVAWFTGRADESAMDTSARAFAPDMRMIAPDGGIASSAEVVAMLRRARAILRDDFEIRVKLVESRLLSPELALVTYDEHQHRNGKRTARRSTALFSPDKDAPEGVVWRFLQETWIENQETEQQGDKA